MEANEILDYWLGPRGQGPPDAERMQSWFEVNLGVDSTIRSRFGAASESAIEGGISEWESPLPERVALVILLDQFPRNVHRGSPRAFAGDLRAMEWVRRTTHEELDSLDPVEAYFMLLPWMHSESLADQQQGEGEFARAAVSVPVDFRPLFENGLAFTTRHQIVIERFGRFPHRNAVLGRTSSAEEAAYLAENPSGF